MKGHAQRLERRVFRHGVGVALVVAAVAATLFVYRASASRGQPAPAPLVNFAASHQRPIAGRIFTGLAMINLSQYGLDASTFHVPPANATLTRVPCDAEIAGKRLPALKRAFFEGSGETSRQVVVCSWRIPADAAGKRLRLWQGDLFGTCVPACGHVAEADIGPEWAGFSPSFSWTVKKR